VLLLVACARTVTVALPPQVELAPYPTIGVIEFAAEPGELGAAATQKFIGNLHAAQPGLRFLELGRRRELLREVGGADLDYRAIRAIGEKYRVAAVMTGTVELSEVRPDLTVAANLASISAKAKVDGRMSAKLWETTSGATAWSNSSWGVGPWRALLSAKAGWSKAASAIPRSSRTRFSWPWSRPQRRILAALRAAEGGRVA